MTEAMALETLRQAGNFNPRRMADLMRATITRMKLDLSAMTILTEAASGVYSVTPVIAALAGAKKVLAVTRESKFATVAEVMAQTRAMEVLCGLEENRVEIHNRRTLDLFAQADVVTNLGFVRPVDEEAVAAMKATAVISLMCESWELRPGDVALDACRKKGVPVLGVDEDHPDVRVFEYSGPLALKMLIEAQIELHKALVVIISGDKFGLTIARYLAKAGISSYLYTSLVEARDDVLARADAVLIADYCRENEVIGQTGDFTAEEFVQAAPLATVIQFAGSNDVEGLRRQGVIPYPDAKLQSWRMAQTLASLGPRPVIELHTAGIKVGAALAQARQMTSDPAEIIAWASEHSPSQMV
ncbi:MAG: hypothetical protein HQK55_03280 [Deltaproteobacteria bacterium]|nr:hypothetical protein [Deltaproteobacteria bacterium]